MGNICGKQEPDNFAGAGRVVGSAPRAQTKSSVPPNVSRGKGHTLGGSSSSGGGGNDTPQLPASKQAQQAAIKRYDQLKENGNKDGKLQQKLNQQKRESRTKTLKEASAQNLSQREEAEDATKRRDMN